MWDEGGKKGNVEVEVSCELTSAGKVVLETMMPGTPGEMMTVYYVDGEDLVLLHYCASGNQPRMKLEPSTDAADLKFRCLGGTNVTEADVVKWVAEAELARRNSARRALLGVAVRVCASLKTAVGWSNPLLSDASLQRPDSSLAAAEHRCGNNRRSFEGLSAGFAEHRRKVSVARTHRVQPVWNRSRWPAELARPSIPVRFVPIPGGERQPDSVTDPSGSREFIEAVRSEDKTLSSRRWRAALSSGRPASNAEAFRIVLGRLDRRLPQNNAVKP